MTQLNKIILGAVAIYAFSPLTFTHAEEGKAYVGANIGIGIPAKKFDYDDSTHQLIDPTKLKKSNIFGIALGYGITNNVRAELAINHFQNFKYQATNKQDADTSYKQKISSTSAFINGYYDINEMNGFIPYVSIGFGFSKK